MATIVVMVGRGGRPMRQAVCRRNVRGERDVVNVRINVLRNIGGGYISVEARPMGDGTIRLSAVMMDADGTPTPYPQLTWNV